MPDISMCGDLACPSRKACYRHPESGTRPKSRAQTWFSFRRPADADRCAEFWPAETAVPTVAGKLYLQNQGAA
jgi:hypothetical protein